MPDRILYSDDCLNVANDELALPTGSVDLIYLDPPFNSKSIYNLPFAGKDKDTRPVEAFNDAWTWGVKEDELLRSLLTLVDICACAWCKLSQWIVALVGWLQISLFRPPASWGSW